VRSGSPHAPAADPIGLVLACGETFDVGMGFSTYNTPNGDLDFAGA